MTARFARLFDHPEGEGIEVVLAIAGGDGADNGVDQATESDSKKGHETDSHDQGQGDGNQLNDEHGELKVEGLFAGEIDLGEFILLQQPANCLLYTSPSPRDS